MNAHSLYYRIHAELKYPTVDLRLFVKKSCIAQVFPVTNRKISLCLAFESNVWTRLLVCDGIT